MAGMTRKHIIDVDTEELQHIQDRRAAVERFKNFCQRPVPDPKDEVAMEDDTRAMTRMEDELRTKWGVQV